MDQTEDVSEILDKRTPEKRENRDVAYEILRERLNAERPETTVGLYQGYTLTLNSKWQELKTVLQYKRSRDLILKYAKKRQIELYLVPELTQNGNIHYHGYMWIEGNPNAIRLMVNYLRRNLGYVHITEATNRRKIEWWDYIHKDLLMLDYPTYKILKRVAEIGLLID